LNKRLDHITEVASIDFINHKVGLVQPSSEPRFIYTEKLENIILLEDTGVKLDDICVYTNDIVTDGTKQYNVVKVPGGYYPFMLPNKKNFRRV